MVESEDLDSLNYGFSEQDLESARDNPIESIPVTDNKPTVEADNLDFIKKPSSGMGESHPEIDIDSQYKIAKKKELIVKKLS